MAKNKSNVVRLNLGCGAQHKPGYWNVDIDPSLNPDEVIDLRKPLPYITNSVQSILLQDVLEHLTKEDGLSLLTECARILRFGGIITVRVPNPIAIIQKFRWQPDLLLLYLYGDTSQNGEWGAHKYGYTPSLWNETSAVLNLTPVSYQAVDTNYIFVAKKSKTIRQRPIVYCASLGQFLCTPWYYLQGAKVIWKIDEPYSSLLGKIVLRPLALLTTTIVVGSDSAHRFATQVLKYSHLRILHSARDTA
ncbi:MAG: hypothetical protein A2632_00390 [Candidatus Pacebacteria bacterium RIFCSPHIGHO2_01_FULL_46_16]|nr:MAG: hypothetical protein A2632_00390 [Candidatus Pacebacteria bacterium RIFCSPHIGHO2_01_FULL_46_16]OGJ21087.1 MAG: hypothetical protein A3J60_03710 [Candidatus Pacebacteria bacterium RIFCSPHIGHO2_02_FULL_46_9]OGJ38743.1 MAG: hypothetical protein A3A82_03385 [Candidatus Pacebacteria bacterium RIFCSPLOWO2_01_FULL_47_12]